MERPAPTITQTAHKQVHIKEEPEVSPPRREPKCSFCREETHSYQTCLVLRQVVLEQVNELTHRRLVEYEKSQEEAIRHTIREEYGPTTSVSDPMATRSGTSTLLHPSGGGAGRVGPMGKGQTPEGPSWWSQLGDSRDDQQTQPQEGGTGDARGANRGSNQLPRYQTPFTKSTPYMMGGYRYQGTGIGPSGGLPGRGGQPPGRGCGSGGGDGYCHGAMNKKELVP